MKVELTNKEVSAIVASIDFMAKYITSTVDKPDELTGKKMELIKQFSKIMDKLNK